MSRERNEEKKGLSPTQRKACVVLALCALAVVMSILAASAGKKCWMSAAAAAF